jgi:hypothetical protein
MTGSHEARGSSPLSSTIYDRYKVGQTADLFYLAGTGFAPSNRRRPCRMNPGLPAGPPHLDIASRLA